MVSAKESPFEQWPLLDEGSSVKSKPGLLTDDHLHDDKLRAAGAAFLYAIVATSMNFVNKATIQYFPLPMTILLMQMVATIAVLLPLSMRKVITIGPFCWEKAYALAPITALYTANTAFALVGLRTLNIPMYSTLKRLTPVIVLITKAVSKRQMPAWDAWASVLLVMGGCICAGLGDLTFNISGYSCALLSCFLQASYLLLVEHSGAKHGMGTSELLAYSAALSAPVLLVMCVLTGELASMREATALGVEALGPGPLAFLVVSCSLCGCLLNYTLFLCTMWNSALMTTMVGVLKGVVVTVLGFFLLGGVQFHVLNVVGVSLNMAGGTWYTILHYAAKYSGGSVAAKRSPFPASASMMEVGQFRPHHSAALTQR